MAAGTGAVCSAAAWPAYLGGLVLGAALVCLLRRAARPVSQVEPQLDELMDTTLRLRARERGLQQILEEVEAQVSASEQQLSSISHELRTPLSSIRAYSEILIHYAEDEPAELREDFLKVIMLEAERLGRLVNDLLDISKLDAAETRWEPERFDLSRLLRQTLLGLGGLCAEKQVDFDLRAPADPVEIDGVPDRLHQALVNLCANAWRFSPPGGRVLIELESVAGQVRLCVADQGPGVAEAERERIFERFVQGGEPGAARQGTGLGLAITRGIIERHGGSICCGAAAGGGAAFHLRLPSRSAQMLRPGE